MKRRDFLQTAGFLSLGSAGALGRAPGAAEAGQAQAPAAAQARPATPLTKNRVLITSAHSRLAQAIAAALAGRYPIRLTAPAAVPGGYEFTQSDLDDDGATRALVRGVEGIVHAADPPPGAGGEMTLDWRTRSTYNLFLAAAQEGVRRVIHLSSLALMTAYDEDFDVAEGWRPRPGPQPEGLSHYLGECIAREFAHQKRLRIAVLRLGKVVRPEEVAGKPFDPLWVAEDDVVQAVSLALERPGTSDAEGWWSVYHIASGSPRARFSIAAAQRGLGYRPKFHW